MKNPENLRTYIKKEIVSNIVKAFFEEDPAEKMRLIPFRMKEKNPTVLRCCTYHDREVLANRALATLGFSIEDRDETKLLSTYYEEAMKRERPDPVILTVLESACHKCVPNRIQVTDLCQGCLTRSCMAACKFDAIQHINSKSVIDSKLCRNCGKCIEACPYVAIVRYHVPCEEACPVKAMTKDEDGCAKIQFDKCISCGKCVHACPFGAVHEKSQIIDILKHIKNNSETIILLAPSIMWQFEANIKQLRTAFIKAGFSDVYEVAQGADITTKNESEEFEERVSHGKAPFMTTSCCAAYNELLDKHLEEMRPFVSETRTPLGYISEIAKKASPNAKIVFASPCVAKRKEGQKDENVDYIINFEECVALFEALNIVPEECEESEYCIIPSQEARNYAVSSGVAKAVQKKINNPDLKSYCINGITKQSLRELRSMAKNKRCDQGNLVEVMSCQGGCIGGNACLSRTKVIRKTSPVS